MREGRKFFSVGGVWLMYVCICFVCEGNNWSVLGMFTIGRAVFQSWSQEKLLCRCFGFIPKTRRCSLFTGWTLWLPSGEIIFEPPRVGRPNTFRSPPPFIGLLFRSLSKKAKFLLAAGVVGVDWLIEFTMGDDCVKTGGIGEFGFEFSRENCRLGDLLPRLIPKTRESRTGEPGFVSTTGMANCGCCCTKLFVWLGAIAWPKTGLTLESNGRGERLKSRTSSVQF